MTKSKKLYLSKANSAEVNSRTDFLTLEVKEAFIYLQKTFTKVPIFHHFDTKRHIYIKTDISKYAIGVILSQMTLDQCFSDHVIYKDSDFSKSEIS